MPGRLRHHLAREYLIDAGTARSFAAVPPALSPVRESIVTVTLKVDFSW
jgi:hypothetical protein